MRYKRNILTQSQEYNGITITSCKLKQKGKFEPLNVATTASAVVEKPRTPGAIFSADYNFQDGQSIASYTTL